MRTSFFSEIELRSFNFKSCGRNVLISRKASLYKPETLSFGDDVRVDDFCILSGGQGIQIGSNVHVGAYTALYGNQGITIGDFCGFSSRAVIYTFSDDYSGATLTNPTIPNEFKSGADKGPVTLGRHVIIGTNSTILPDINIGEGAALGAHSLLTRDIEPWSIFFGAPAKFIKKRKKDLLKLELSYLESKHALSKL